MYVMFKWRRVSRPHHHIWLADVFGQFKKKRKEKAKKKGLCPFIRTNINEVIVRRPQIQQLSWRALFALCSRLSGDTSL